MKDLFERLKGDLDFTRLATYLEDRPGTQGHVFAQQVRELRDRIVRGVPVMGTDLDIESYLAYDVLKQIRQILLCPDERSLIQHAEYIATLLQEERTSQNGRNRLSR